MLIDHIGSAPSGLADKRMEVEKEEDDKTQEKQEEEEPQQHDGRMRRTPLKSMIVRQSFGQFSWLKAITTLDLSRNLLDKGEPLATRSIHGLFLRV